MNEHQFQALLKRYLSGKCNAQEIAQLETWYLNHEAKGLSPLSDMQLEAIHQTTAPLPSKTGRIWPFRHWAAAAVAIVTIGAATWFWVSREPDEAVVHPGGNRATLTLADGRTIELSEAQTGIIVGNGITYVDGSDLLDNRQGAGKESLTTNHYVLSTPKGGTYQITLPDGSTVWLNANSTLRYPGRFKDSERIVELEGEAYFDVKQRITDDRQQSTANGPRAEKVPFLVKTAGQTVEVLGTEFNVSAYADEPATRTTLVEGSVRLTRPPSAGSTLSVGGTQLTLVPGEQGISTTNGMTKLKVNTEAFVAWKDGYFFFDEQPLSVVMSQLANWYDVAFVFEDLLQDKLLYGTISRQKTLNQALTILENTRAVKFSVKDNTVFINRYERTDN